MKNPAISSVKDVRDPRGSGDGRIKSDCAYALDVSMYFRITRRSLLFDRLGTTSEDRLKSLEPCRCECTEKEA